MTTNQTIGEKYNLNNQDVRLTYTQAVNLSSDLDELIYETLEKIKTDDIGKRQSIESVKDLIYNETGVLDKSSKQSARATFSENSMLTESHKEKALNTKFFYVETNNEFVLDKDAKALLKSFGRACSGDFVSIFIRSDESVLVKHGLIQLARTLEKTEQLFGKRFPGEQSPLPELLGFTPGKIDFNQIVKNIRPFDASDKRDWDTLEADIFETERSKVLYNAAVKKFLTP